MAIKLEIINSYLEITEESNPPVQIFKGDLRWKKYNGIHRFTNVDNTQNFMGPYTNFLDKNNLVFGSDELLTLFATSVAVFNSTASQGSVVEEILPSPIPLVANVVYNITPTANHTINFDTTSISQGLSEGVLIYNGFVGNTHSLLAGSGVVIKGDAIDVTKINYIEYEAIDGVIKFLNNSVRTAVIVQVDTTAPTVGNFRVEDDYRNRIKFDSSELGTGSTAVGFFVNGVTPTSTFINTIATTGHYLVMPSDLIPGVTYNVTYAGGSDIKDNATPNPNSLAPFGSTPVTNSLSVVDPYTTYYFDSAYVGTKTGSITEPFNNFDPITNNTIVKNTAKYLLKKGSLFRDSIDLDGAINVIIDAYGTGDKPIISGSQIFTTFTAVGGQPNVWQATFTKEITAIGRIKVFENGNLLKPAGNLTGCNSTPGTYVRLADVTAPSASVTVQFHASDSGNPNSNGKSYEISVRGAVRGIQNTKKIQISNIVTQNQVDNNGSVDFIFGELDNAITNVIAKNGDKHNALIGQGIVNSLTCWGMQNPNIFGDGSPLVLYTDVSNTATIKRVIANKVSIIQPSFLDSNVNAIAIYSHTDGSPGTVYNFHEINQLVIHRQGGVIGGSFGDLTMRKVFTSQTNIIDMGGITGSLLLENFSMLFTGLSNLPFTKTNNTFKNGITHKLRAGIQSSGFLPATLTMENYTATSDTVQISFLDNVAYVMPSVTANLCVVHYIYNFVRTTNYVGNKNIFGAASTTTSFGAMILNGTTYTQLRKWQIASGQDADSVEITKDLEATFAMTTVGNGDWRFASRSVGRAGNLRLFRGTFADGLTPLALSGANDMPISHPTMPNTDGDVEAFHELMKTWYDANIYIRPIDIVHARVNNANRDRVLLVFSKAVNLTNTSALSLTFSSGTAKTITGIQAGNGTYNVWLQLSAPIDPADVFTIDWTTSATISYVDFPTTTILAGTQTVENRAYGTIAGLVAHYPFTANLNDVSGNNNTATAIGALTYSGRGVKFTDGQNVITPPITLGVNYTVSFWLDYNNLAYATNIYVFGSGATSQEAFKINRSNETVQWNGNATFGADAMSGQYRNDTQIHFTIVRQGTSAKLYRFDELLATITSINSRSGQQIYIGSDRATAQTFDGYVRSFKYYSTNLSDADVKKNFYSEL